MFHGQHIWRWIKKIRSAKSSDEQDNQKPSTAPRVLPPSPLPALTSSSAFMKNWSLCFLLLSSPGAKAQTCNLGICGLGVTSSWLRTSRAKKNYSLRGKSPRACQWETQAMRSYWQGMAPKWSVSVKMWATWPNSNCNRWRDRFMSGSTTSAPGSIGDTKG